MPRISIYRQLWVFILFTLLFFIFYELISIKTNNHNELIDDYTHCLLDVHQALDSLSIPWFITFGSALMYWRSKNFISHDIDIGIFYKDLKQKAIRDRKFVSIMRKKFHFKFLHRYDELNKSSDYWSATYHGLCNNMIYKKCRWKFKQFNLTTFEMFKKKFNIVPIEFIEERYGKNYTIPHKYSYFESLKFLPNLIEEYNVDIENNKQQ
ncbi:unnamed protein product [Rotaria sp. Silwood1]|nr:unnamed protein product [Rotaria sp. Silwood1]